MKWSFSTHNALRRCERQVFLTSRYAYAQPSDPARRRAWVLKQAQGERMWIGAVIHAVLAARLVPALASAQTAPSEAELINAARELGERQFAFSEAGRFNDEGVSKKSAGRDFCVLEWDVNPDRLRPPDPLASLADTARTCFMNLRRNDMQQLLKSATQAATVTAERRLIFEVGPHLATATLDLLASGRQGHMVVDWKVSASATADNTFQLDTYGLAVCRCISGAVAGTVEVAEANLLTGTVRRRTPTQEDLDLAENAIRRSAASLQSLDPQEENDLVQFAAGLVATNNPNTCAMCSMQPFCADLEVVDRYRAPEPQGRLVFV